MPKYIPNDYNQSAMVVINYLDHLEQHKKLDERESADEARKARHQQSIDTLNKAHDKITDFLKTVSPRMGQGKKRTEVKSNITDNESAKRTTP